MNLPAGAAIPQNHAARAHGTEIINTLSPQRTERRSQRNIRVQDPNAWAVALGSPGNVQHESAEMLVQDGTDIRYFIDKCTEATSQGRIAAARVYYQMALDRMSPEQKKRMETLQARNAEAAKGKKPKKDKPAANSSATAAAATAPGAAPANGADSPTDQDASPF